VRINHTGPALRHQKALPRYGSPETSTGAYKRNVARSARVRINSSRLKMPPERQVTGTADRSSDHQHKQGLS